MGNNGDNYDGGGDGSLGAVFTNSQSTNNREIATMIILQNKKANCKVLFLCS